MYKLNKLIQNITCVPTYNAIRKIKILNKTILKTNTHKIKYRYLSILSLSCKIC